MMKSVWFGVRRTSIESLNRLVMVWGIAFAGVAMPVPTQADEITAPPNRNATLGSDDRLQPDARLSQLYVSIQQALMDERIPTAIDAQKSVIVLLQDQLGGCAKWRLACEELYLNELKQVSSLPAEEQHRYSAAVKTVAKAIEKSKNGNLENAENDFLEARQEIVALVGLNSISSASTLEKVALFRFVRKDYQGTKETALRTADAWKSVVGEDHPNFPNALSIAAAACCELNEYRESERLMRDVLPR